MNTLSLANRLETILTKYLDCHYGNFGVKANGYLDDYDWKSAIYFALGCKYGESNKDSKLKDIIDSFLGNTLKGKNMQDLVNNYEDYSFNSREEAFLYIENTIKKFQEILNM